MNLREIVVISGKGGTGKTTLTASFAAVADERRILADGDVDAPNLALLLHPRETEQHPFWGMAVAHVDPEGCTGCGKCEDCCRYKAIHVAEGMALVDRSFCEGCRSCIQICPEQCISLNTFQRGIIKRGETDQGPLWHARLTPGGENTGLLVALLRREARKEAEKTGVQLIIVDGPPGIGCPVTSSITGADFAVIVTEPSKSSLSDLRRAAELCGILSTPFGVVVNRWNLSEGLTETIRKACCEEGWPLLGTVPFDERIAEAVGEGRIPLSEMGSVLVSLWRSVLETGRLKK
mgnify:CR=1 FL=1